MNCQACGKQELKMGDFFRVYYYRGNLSDLDGETICSKCDQWLISIHPKMRCVCE